MEAKIEKYLKIPYTARWTLKVTWEKAPAYPSQQDDAQVTKGTATSDGWGMTEPSWMGIWGLALVLPSPTPGHGVFLHFNPAASSVCALGRGEGGCGVLTCGFLQTSTYQAVLSTDGNQSFALLLYQDGAMRWDYAGLAAGNVLIGFSRCPAFWDTPYSSTVLGPPRHLLPRRAQLPPRPTPSLLTPLSANWQEKPTEPPSLEPGRALCAEPSPRWAGSGDRGVGGRPQPNPNPSPALFTQR